MGKRKNISQNNIHKQEKEIACTESTSSLLERSQYSLDLVNMWINSADTKVSISCGVFSVIIAVIVFTAENILGNLEKPEQINCLLYSLFSIAVIVTVIGFLASIFFHLWAINPSFFSGSNYLKKLSKQDLAKPSFSIFYDEIRSFKSPADYIKTAKNVSEEQFADEILKEIYCNSKICSQKMRRFKTGITLAFITIGLCIISCILYYCSYVCV